VKKNSEFANSVLARIEGHLAPVHYMIRIPGPLAIQVEMYAAEEGYNAETIVLEAIRAYMGDAK
jgi:hypothetical protein